MKYIESMAYKPPLFSYYYGQLKLSNFSPNSRMAFDLKFPPTETVKLLANYLKHIINLNDKRLGKNRKPSRFHARQLPSIDILGYLNRILKYAPCGTDCFLAMLIYIERISVNGQLLYAHSQQLAEQSDPISDLETQLEKTRLTAANTEQITLDSFNVHRLLISAAVLSIKFLSDVFYTNLHVSRKVNLK